MLQHRNDRHCLAMGFYTYDSFINATHAFPEFGTAGDEASRRREIAAFLGQTSHETTGGWEGLPSDPYIYGYCIVKDPHLGQFDYCDHWDKRHPCAPRRQYYGRGPFQLTWNSNYELAGEFLGLDLINNPDLVATYSNIAFETAIWLWMTPSQGKPSPHEVMIGEWKPSDYDRRAGRLPGYGLTTNIINGGLECGKGRRGRDREAIGFYLKYCEMLNVDPGDNLDCSHQVPYDERHRSWAAE